MNNAKSSTFELLPFEMLNSIGHSVPIPMKMGCSVRKHMNTTSEFANLVICEKFITETPIEVAFCKSNRDAIEYATRIACIKTLQSFGGDTMG